MTTVKISGIEYQLTDEKKRRIFQSIEETERLLEKELSYMEDLQNKDRIEFYRSHISKLCGWLA